MKIPHLLPNITIAVAVVALSVVVAVLLYDRNQQICLPSADKKEVMQAMRVMPPELGKHNNNKTNSKFSDKQQGATGR